MRLLALLCLPWAALAAEHPFRFEQDIAYRPEVEGQDAYTKARCKLNLAVPTDTKGFATYVWFYGGGLKNGSKDESREYCADIAKSFAQAGVACVTPDYRLSPKAKYPSYVDDAAASFAWTIQHIAEFGGDPRKVFIGGHSAGGYLALLVGFDPDRLKPYGLTLGSVAGIAQVSGQVFTHYTVREERGISKYSVVADEGAPCFYVKKALPPILTIYAQNDMIGRAEENQFMVAMLKSAGHTENYSLRANDRDHGSVGHSIRNADDPARLAILSFISKQAANR